MTLTEIQGEIADYIGIDSYPNLNNLINDAVEMVAGGVKLPDGRVTPPLPDLLKIGTVDTTSDAYTDLPSDYQRNLFMVSRSNGVQVMPPDGGDYYSFAKFVYQTSKKTLTLTGSPRVAVVKGRKLYYQGIPSSAETLTIMYYRYPTRATVGSDEIEGLTDEFCRRVIRNYVCAYYSRRDKKEYDFFMNEYIMSLIDLANKIGIDEYPQFYGEGNVLDYGVCD